MWWNARRNRQDEERDLFRQARRMLKEDVMVLGAALDDMRGDLESFPEVARGHFRGAEVRHEQVRATLSAAHDLETVRCVEPQLVEARWHLAALRAVRADQDMPSHGEECFFNSQHGPASQTVEWAAPGREADRVAACRACAQRLADGEAPDHRLVLVGDRRVPWWLGVSSGDRKSGRKAATRMDSDHLMSATDAAADSVAKASWFG